MHKPDDCENHNLIDSLMFLHEQKESATDTQRQIIDQTTESLIDQVINSCPKKTCKNCPFREYD